MNHISCVYFASIFQHLIGTAYDALWGGFLNGFEKNKPLKSKFFDANGTRQGIALSGLVQTWPFQRAKARIEAVSQVIHTIFPV